MVKVKYEMLCQKIEDASTMFAPCEDYPKMDKKNHPTSVKIITEEEDVPHLVYISREKRPEKPHHFKAGANALTRVSGLMTNAPFLLNELHKSWQILAGDARNFTTDEPYIEVVTSPNNPDGSIRQAVAKEEKGIRIHDLAYYWPQYAPITHQADEDIKLFTISKSIGHAGSRIGWALVKDPKIAKKMTKYMEISTIGVSKDSHIRAARILQAVSDDYDSIGNVNENERFFDYSKQEYLKEGLKWLQREEYQKVGYEIRFALILKNVGGAGNSTEEEENVVLEDLLQICIEGNI